MHPNGVPMIFMGNPSPIIQQAPSPVKKIIPSNLPVKMPTQVPITLPLQGNLPEISEILINRQTDDGICRIFI
jgi:hypothetical protein